jgi:hypothetical protein
VTDSGIANFYLHNISVQLTNIFLNDHTHDFKLPSPILAFIQHIEHVSRAGTQYQWYPAAARTPYKPNNNQPWHRRSDRTVTCVPGVGERRAEKALSLQEMKIRLLCPKQLLNFWLRK